MAARDRPPPVATAVNATAWLGVALLAGLSLWLLALPLNHPWREGTTRLIVTLSATILSFLAGTRLGLAMRDETPAARRTALFSLLPAAAAWLCGSLQPPHVFALLALAFAAQGAWDAFAVNSEEAPVWYGRLRTLATVAAVIVLMPALIATA